MSIVREKVDFLKAVFVSFRSKFLVKWYGLYYNIEFDKGVNIRSKLNIYGYGKTYTGKKTCFDGVAILGTTNKNSIIKIGKGSYI